MSEGAMIEASRAPKTREMFAEMYVAAKLADAGWELYFPRRDRGIDMIAVKTIAGDARVRPIQVKGLYPTAAKTKKAYGYVGRISAWHTDMILALPYFSLSDDRAPLHIAWLSRDQIKPHKRGWRCQPARFDGSIARPLESWSMFFDAEGLSRLDRDP